MHFILTSTHIHTQSHACKISYFTNDTSLLVKAEETIKLHRKISIPENALQNHAKILIHLDNSNTFPYKYHTLVIF